MAEIINSHNWVPKEHETALIIIDFQEYFRNIINPVLHNILSIIKSARCKKIPLIFTQHGNTECDIQGSLSRWWADLIIKGSKSAELLKEIRVRQNEYIIQKTTYSAFYKTELETLLEKLEVSDLVIAGVMTNLCCETTARDAFVRDYNVFVLKDGTATSDNSLHVASLKNLAYGFATIVSCKQLSNILSDWR